jgi:hypothetical protein
MRWRQLILYPLALGALPLGAFFLPTLAGAQAPTARDTAFAVKARRDLDSLARDKTAPSYSKRAQIRLRARVDSLLRAPVASPPVPPVDTVVPSPPPVDTVTPPPPPPPVTTTDTIAQRAELPRAVPAPVFGKALRVVNVLAGTITGDLQGALNASLPGDSLVLSGTFTGNYTLPQRACGIGITVTSAGVLPPAGTRVSPATAAPFAKIVTPNQGPALKTQNPTCGWRLAGFEIGVAYTGLNYGVVWLGDGGYADETQKSLAMVPQQILVDRVYLHGNAASNTTRCLNLNSANTVVRDSYISECHAVGFESHAIGGWNTPGNLLIENSMISGAGINLFFGGADPAIAGLIPSDITVRRNHIWKDPAWKGLYPAKGVVELKNAQRVLYEDNVLENSWPSGQSGMCVVFKSQTGNEQGANLWQGSTDVTFRWNVVRNCQRGLNLQAVGEGGSDRHVARVVAENNLFTGIGTSNGIAPSDGWLLLLTHDLKDITIAHNTFIGNAPDYGLAAYFSYSGGAAQRIAITDNILAGQSYYALGGDGGNHTAALTGFAGTSWSFTGNVISEVDGQFVGLNPPGNTYVDALSKLGLTPTGASTVYPTKGADVLEVLRRTAGVVIP